MRKVSLGQPVAGQKPEDWVKASLKEIENASNDDTALTKALTAYTTTADLTTLLAAKAPLASPSFTGLITAGGGQIKFPATQAPSADANTLDDYEEGTFTPTVTFATPGDWSPTYATQLGVYIKIGARVFASVALAFDANAYATAAGILHLGGLPFAAGGGLSHAASISKMSNVTFAGQIVGDFANTLSYVTLWSVTSNAGAASLTTAAIPPSKTGVVINYSVSYSV